MWSSLYPLVPVWTGVLAPHDGEHCGKERHAPVYVTGKPGSTITYTVKKGLRFSRSQPGCHLPNSPPRPGRAFLQCTVEDMVENSKKGQL